MLNSVDKYTSKRHMFVELTLLSAIVCALCLV